MSNLRKAHNVPVRGVITKGAHTCDIMREKVNSADEESLDHISGGSGTEEMESVPLPKNFVVQDIPKTLWSDSAGTSVLARSTVPLAPQRVAAS